MSSFINRSSPSNFSTLREHSFNINLVDLVENSCEQFNEPTTIEINKKPEIIIIDQPTDKFRFRYKSEMMGTHGSLASANSLTKRKRRAPTVQLRNFPGKAIIRCTIVTKNIDKRIPHAHHLVKREDNIETDHPYEIQVFQENDWIATFHGMGIIHTAKKNIKEQLIKKMRMEALEKHQQNDYSINSLSVREETQIKLNAEQAQKWIDLNSVALCFQAFIPNKHGILFSITPPVYSSTINNLKSALTGELKICRIDKYVSSCEGGDEVFLLVEKVGKKNIKIKFFETDNKNNEIWSDYGRFSELDVHHQYAIVFRTPPYKDREIISPREVFIQLFRPTDGDCSDPIKFTYKPSEYIRRKRLRIMSYSDNIDLNNPITSDTTMTNNILAFPSEVTTSSDLSIELKKLAFEKCSSNEFKEYLNNINVNDYINYIAQNDNINNQMTINSELCFDGNQLNKKSLPNLNFTINILKNVLSKNKNNSDIFIKNFKKLLNQRSSYGDTPLHFAIRYDQRQLIKHILCIIGTSPEFIYLLNLQNISGKTSLHYAAILNQPDIIQTLLALGADPNICDNNGMNPLHEAVKNPDYWQCVDLLLKAMSNYNALDNAGWSALHLAAEAGSLKSIDLLIKAGSDVNSFERSYGRTALHIAVEQCHIDVVQYLLEKTNISVNQLNLGGNTALQTATVNKELWGEELCKLLLKYGGHFNKQFYNDKRDDFKREIQGNANELKSTSRDLQFNNYKINVFKTRKNNQQEENSLQNKSNGISDWLNIDEISHLGSILEQNNGWKNLAKCLGCYYLFSSLETSGANPAITVLNYADVIHINLNNITYIMVQDDIKMSKLLQVLQELKQIKAVKFIEDIMKNRMNL